MSIDRGSTNSDASSNYSLDCFILIFAIVIVIINTTFLTSSPCLSSYRSLQSLSSSDENLDDALKTEVTEAFCSTLLRQLNFDSIPQECHTFAFQRSNSSNNNAKSSASTKVVAVEEEANPFAGMPAHQQLNAQSARARGRLNQAQIMRRMSSRAKPKERSWF